MSAYPCKEVEIMDNRETIEISASSCSAGPVLIIGQGPDTVSMMMDDWPRVRYAADQVLNETRMNKGAE